MRLSSFHAVSSALLLLASTPLLAMPHLHRGPTSPKGAHRHASRMSTQVSAAHTSAAPAGIGPARATQIQTALIRNGYMTGEPTGVWDSSSQAAMVKLQAENGWQTKLVPDSRALIKLGLGPGSIPGVDTADLAIAASAGSQ